jgi:precorrin-4 C11-methyltransferase
MAPEPTAVGRAPVPGIVYIVGVGPGDPELMTIRAKRIIDAADLLLYTGSLLREGVFQDVKPSARIVDSASLHLDEIVALMRDAARGKEIVARVHDGDPAIFGALSEQAAPLEAAGIPVEVVPGVTAAFAAAAALKVELTIPELAQTVILTRMEGRTPVPDGEKLRDLARHGTTVVLYLSIALIDRVVAELRQGYADDTPVAVVQRAFCPDQTILRGTLGDIAGQVKAARMRAQAVVMVGPVFRPDLRQTWDRKSRLYAADFSHGFRRARRDGRSAAADPALADLPEGAEP